MTSVAEHTSVMWPAPGTEANLDINPEIAALTAQIDEGLRQTQAWVAEHHPGYNALVLDDPYVWELFPAEVQKIAGEWMADILAETYGPDGNAYPLKPYIGAEHNTEKIAEGSMLPYFIVLVPEQTPEKLTKEAVLANPELLLKYREQIKPASVCARVKKGDGSEEHGRAAKMQGPEYRGVSTKAIILQAYKHAMLEGAPVYADVRAAAEHDFQDAKVASGAPTQAIYLGKTGLVPTQFVPGRYWVGGNEPFVTGAHEQSWPHHAGRFEIYTTKGDHVELINTLAELQTGQVPPIRIATNGVGAYLRATAEYPPEQAKGKIYVSVHIDPEQTSHDATELLATLHEADQTAPATVVEVPAHTAEGAATQELLLQEGFEVCGYKAAHERGGVVQPPVVYMARPGKPVRSGKSPLAPTQLPTGVYDERLHRAFKQIDQRARNQITR